MDEFAKPGTWMDHNGDWQNLNSDWERHREESTREEDKHYVLVNLRNL